VSEPLGFTVTQEAYEGTLSGLAYALRTGSVAPRDLNLLQLVRDALAWFEHEAERSLEDAALALPQVAQVIELKVRLLLPRPPREVDEDPEDEAQGPLLDALEVVAALEDLEDAIDFLRQRRIERAGILPARTPRPDLPRPPRPMKATIQGLAMLASTLRPGAYFELGFERMTIEAAVKKVRQAIRAIRRGTLGALVPTRSWAERTVVFAAFLELVREGQVVGTQEEAYGEIGVESTR